MRKEHTVRVIGGEHNLAFGGRCGEDSRTPGNYAMASLRRFVGLNSWAGVFRGAPGARDRNYSSRNISSSQAGNRMVLPARCIDIVSGRVGTVPFAHTGIRARRYAFGLLSTTHERRSSGASGCRKDLERMGRRHFKTAAGFRFHGPL